MAEADPQTPPAGQAIATEKSKGGRGKRIAIMLSVPLVLLAAAFFYWQSQQGKVTTDNAYIKQDMVAVSSEVGGRIVEVLVAENDTVDAGDLLFRIDPEPFQLQLQAANAAIATAEADLTAKQNDPSLTGVDISAAREDIAFARSQFRRQEELMERGFTTRAAYDAAQHAVAQAEERLRQAEAQQAEARARLARGSAVPGQDPRIAAAQAQRASADLNLRRTEIRAPSTGRVAEADRLQIGQQVLPNLPIVTLVSRGSTYIEANFKETDLDHMAPGQRAEIHLDAYPDLVLTGHVASIGAGTGSEFSVLPAQNATGNWIKVTQRVPVRIVLDEESPRPLIAGLSTEVTVFTADDE